MLRQRSEPHCKSSVLEMKVVQKQLFKIVHMCVLGATTLTVMVKVTKRFQRE